MYKTQEVIEQLAGESIVQKLVAFLEQNFEDFPEVYRKYKYALEMMHDEESVQDIAEAIEGCMASVVFYSGALGIQANMDHYINPAAMTILDVGFEAFLREEDSRQLPEYRKAQSTIDRIFERLSTQDEIRTDILEYISYLETYGPKLAHYIGFAFGDDILQRIVLGYHPDRILTMQYGAMIDAYFGKHISYCL